MPVFLFCFVVVLFSSRNSEFIHVTYISYPQSMDINCVFIFLFPVATSLKSIGLCRALSITVTSRIVQSGALDAGLGLRKPVDQPQFCYGPSETDFVQVVEVLSGVVLSFLVRDWGMAGK